MQMGLQRMFLSPRRLLTEDDDNDSTKSECDEEALHFPKSFFQHKESEQDHKHRCRVVHERYNNNINIQHGNHIYEAAYCRLYRSED